MAPALSLLNQDRRFLMCRGFRAHLNTARLNPHSYRGYGESEQAASVCDLVRRGDLAGFAAG